MQAMLMPRTWWQHLKLALRTRWPRLLRRVRVEWAPAWKVDLRAPESVEHVEAVFRAQHESIRTPRHLRVVKGDD